MYIQTKILRKECEKFLKEIEDSTTVKWVSGVSPTQYAPFEGAFSDEQFIALGVSLGTISHNKRDYRSCFENVKTVKPEEFLKECQTRFKRK